MDNYPARIVNNKQNKQLTESINSDDKETDIFIVCVRAADDVGM
jgi:hypothetical protein